MAASRGVSNANLAGQDPPKEQEDGEKEAEVPHKDLEGLLNMNFNMHDKLSLINIKDNLKMMAKTEGGQGLDEGHVDFAQVAELIHLLNNMNKGHVFKKELLTDRTQSYQPNLATDCYMNLLIQRVKQIEKEYK